MTKMLFLVASTISLMACGEEPKELHLRFQDATEAQFQAAQTAAAEWMATCPGVSIEVSRDSGDIPLATVPEGSYGRTVGLTHWVDFVIVPKHVEWIHVDVAYSEHSAYWAHEYAHAMGLGHQAVGIRQMVTPSNGHVTPEDCP